MLVTGGDMTVLLAARALMKKYDVEVISENDGPLLDDFLTSGIFVSIVKNPYERLVSPDTKKYDLIFMNSVLAGIPFAANAEKFDVPLVWWIHSAGFMHDGMPFHLLKKSCPKNLFCYGVSHLAIDSFRKDTPSYPIDYLCWGLRDRYYTSEKMEKIIFAIVATVQPKKCQDIFLEAAGYLPPEKRKRCEFWIVGTMNETTEFGQKIRRMAESMPDVKIFGTLRGEALDDVYAKMSVLVCPSLIDTMPIVCAESMMYRHPCIVSENTGMKVHIQPEENGLIVKAGDARDLSRKMEWMIDHEAQIPKMGESARRVYEEWFTEERFEHDLLRIVGDKLSSL